MDFITQARDLYDGRLLDGDIVGQCDTCDVEVTAEESVFVDIDGEVIDGVRVTSCRMRCTTCQTERRR